MQNIIKHEKSLKLLFLRFYFGITCQRFASLYVASLVRVNNLLKQNSLFNLFEASTGWALANYA